MVLVNITKTQKPKLLKDRNQNYLKWETKIQEDINHCFGQKLLKDGNQNY